MDNLKDKKCVGHEQMVKLNEEEIKNYLSEINEVPHSTGLGSQGNFGSWEFLETNKIVKEFKLKDFVRAMEFVNKIAVIAEEEGHHPDIAIYYNKVEITLWSHFISGLSINDFIIAAKIN